MADWPIYTPTSQSKPLDAILSGIGRGTIYTVADADDRDDLLAALSDAGQPAPAADNPVYVHRADTGSLERNTGSGWVAIHEDDTGWVDLTLENGWTAQSVEGTPGYRRKNGVVYLRGRVSGGSATRIATLPETHDGLPLRPNNIVGLPVRDGAGSNVTVVFINAGGEIVTSGGTSSVPNLSAVAYPVG